MAGSHQALPFASGSIDLILSHNSLTRHGKSTLVANALNEAARVLTPSGELRSAPTWLESFDTNGFANLGTNETLTKEQVRDEIEKGYIINEALFFEGFCQLELQGTSFYVTVIKHEGQDFSENLIVRKDGNIPEIFLDQNLEYELRKMRFLDSEEGYRIPSDLVDLQSGKK